MRTHLPAKFLLALIFEQTGAPCIVVHDEAFDGEFLDHCCRRLAEMDGTLGVDLVTNGGNRLHSIMP